MKKIALCAIALALFTSSCKKEKSPSYDANKKGLVNVAFENVVGSSNLTLSSQQYVNVAGDTFNVTKLKYYVSNFTFTKADGSVYTVPQDSSYFLVDVENPTSLTPSFQLPEGEYIAMSFVLGVDSLRNTKDISERTGVLDPTGLAEDMYWGWNSGYIFFKIEGTSPSIVGGMMGNAFQIHIGGFGGYDNPTPNNLNTITLSLSENGIAEVRADGAVQIHLSADVQKVFSGVNTISLATTNMVHSPDAGIVVAPNLANIFSHEHTHNN